MTLLKLLSWPYFRKHRLRSLLTVAGIVLGIAVFTSMHSANQAVLGAFNRTVERIAGKTDLQVSAGESGFEEEVLERVQSLPQVRVAAPVIEAVVDTGLRGQGSLLLLAVDMTGDQSLRDYNLEGGEIDDPLVFLAQPDSILVTREFAARNNLQVNSRISMHTMAGPRQFTIRGLMKPGGLASAFGGNLAVMDIYAAQVILGRGRRFDRIDVAVKEGVPVAECQGALRRHLGPGLEVEPPESRGKNFEALLKVYEAAVNLSSWFALFIGMFIIYNSFSIAVTQRRAEIGILRALGATQGQIRTLFLWESAVAGLIGSLLGIALGVLLAQKLAGFVSQLLGAIFGVTGRPDQVIPQPALLAASVAIGVLTSMAAALVPARAAARVDPVKALNRGAYQVLSAGESRARAILAALCSIASLVCMAYSRSKGAFYTGYILINLAALLLTPWASLWITRTLRPLLKRLRPVEGSLAADSLIAAPRRTSATVAALMLSLAMVVGLGGIAAASYESISEWIASTFNPDLFLS
ncbi:MAG: ABC transporter permease, partial [Candidatus Solibacter usitatus]|nr:ABC transporter permease [Candidatus Solibacter usitatus]